MCTESSLQIEASFPAVIKDPSNANHTIRNLHLTVKDLHREGSVSDQALCQVLSDSVDQLPVGRHRRRLRTADKGIEVEGLSLSVFLMVVDMFMCGRVFKCS